MAWIGVDLDGTLAVDADGGPFDPCEIGPPVPKMVARIQKWKAEGIKVKLVTARAAWGDEVHDAIADWCLEHLGFELPITDRKDAEMICLWDDRAIAVERNTGEFLGWPERYTRKGAWRLE